MVHSSTLQARDLAARTVALLAREHGLTRRETEVLSGASEGRCTKDIAAQMRVSNKTVEYFWARIYRKLGCGSQIEVMALLLRRAYEGRVEAPVDPRNEESRRLRDG